MAADCPIYRLRMGGAEAMRRFAMLLSGLAGIMAFNVIVGVFGLVAAEIGLVAFIIAAVFVIARSSRREEGTHV